MENKDEEKEVIVKEKEIIKEKGGKKRLPYFVKVIIAIAIIFIALGSVVVGVKTVFETQEKVLKLGLEDVGELVTQTCHTVVLEDTKENLSFFALFDIPFTESRQIFSYDFDVDASINFSKVSIDEIDDSKKMVKVKIPHSKIYKVTLNPNSFKSYLDSKGLFSRINLAEHNEALIKMEDTAKTQCLTNLILNRADQNAQRLISAMIMGNPRYKDYNVVYEYIDSSTIGIPIKNNTSDSN